MSNRRHVAVYGSVYLNRSYCEDCKGFYLIIDGKFACCDRKASGEPGKKFKRMSECQQVRHGPSAKWRKAIMEGQNGRCFYCFRTFGSVVYRGTKKLHLRCEWDHVSPYVYSLNNRDQNFVAACHVCNSLKSHKIFNSADEARSYLYEAWERKGFKDQMPGVWLEVPPETPVAKVL